MILITVTDNALVLTVRRICTGAGFLLIPLSALVGLYYPSQGRRFAKAGLPEFDGVSVEEPAWTNLRDLWFAAAVVLS